MEGVRTGRAPSSTSRSAVASFTLGEEILAASADRARPQGRRGNAEEGVAQQDTYRCRDGRWIAVTLATADPGLAAYCATRDCADAVEALLARGIAAAPCHDGADLLSDKALAGVTLARDKRGGLVKGLPYRLDANGVVIERAAPDLGYKALFAE
jgi:benzylsuccinate CoA-transferase BbsF subunit